jgi:hypothetical protein
MLIFYYHQPEQDPAPFHTMCSQIPSGTISHKVQPRRVESEEKEGRSRY